MVQAQDTGASAVADRASAGMTPYGPSHPDYPNAPRDWDGGAYLCRDGGLYYMRGYGWAHGLGCWNLAADWDRVAYTAQTIEAATADETVPGSAVGESVVPAGNAPQVSALTSPDDQVGEGDRGQARGSLS